MTMKPFSCSVVRIVIAAALACFCATAVVAQIPNWCHNPVPANGPPAPPMPPACGGPGGGGGSGGSGGGAAGRLGENGRAGSGTSGAPQAPSSCNLCTGSPCLVASGNYLSSALDLAIPTVGFPLVVSRTYESARPIDGLIGIGWTLNLSAHLYYAAYLYAAPSTYRHEADVVLPNGNRFRFVENTDGTTFTPPAARYDVLIKNSNGSFDLAMADASTKYHFGASGRLETITDEFGNTLVLTYDSSDRLQRIADGGSSGRYLDVFYGANGRVSTIQDHTGRHVTFAYGTDGRLLSVTDPAGRAISYGYTNVRFGPLLTQISDPWGRTLTTVTYDSLGRTATYTEAGETYTYTYNYNGRSDQSSKVDSVGNRWVYTYSSTGVITERTYPGSVQQLVTYNSDSTIAQSTDEVGVKTAYTYAAQGRVETVTKDYTGPLEVRFDYQYDSAFPTKATSVLPKKRNAVTGVWEPHPDWQGWKYDYYQTGSAAPGALWHVYRVRSDGVTTDTIATYTYNTHGQQLTSTDAAGGVTDYTYDTVGTLASFTGPTNNDAATRPVTSYVYDSLGRTTGVVTPDHSGTAPLDVQYVYDAVDRVTETRDHFTTSTGYVTTSVAYDRYDTTSGLLFTDVTDPNGNATHQGYDVHGRLIQSTDALGATTAYAYVRSNLNSITDANGNATSYSYNALGRLTATTFPDGAVEGYTYTADGLLATKTDRKLQTIGYGYDHLKRLTSKSYPGSTSVSYAYTGQKLMQVTDTSVSPSETHGFTYDSSFRISTNTQATRGTITYTYTPSDAVATYAVTGGASAAYTYYADGSLDTIQWSPVSGTFKFTYSPGGAYNTLTFPNGQTRTYGYDQWRRLTSVANVHPTVGNLATYTYVYDTEFGGATNRLDQRTRMLATVPSQSLSAAATNYYYDEGYQLIGAQYPSGLFGGATKRWAYDAIGNRVSEEVFPCPPCSPEFSVLNEYTYQTIGTNPNNWQRLLNGLSTYAYDANGNVTDRGAVTLAWDAENRIKDVADSGTSTTWGNRYDYQGRRTRLLSSSASEKSFMYDGLNLIGRGLSSAIPALTEQFLYGPGIDEPLAMTSSAGIYYYSVDALGSVTLVTSATGTVGTSTAYSAWGDATSFSSALAGQPFGYTARETAESDLLFYRARFYDASVGRFLSEDPVGSNVGQSRYAYVGNAPMTWKDPLGRMRRKDKCKATCPDLLQAIEELAEELAERWADGDKYKGTGTFPRGTTREGHIQKYEELQENLNEFIDEYLKRCGPPPARAVEWSRRPHPYPPLPNKPNTERSWSPPRLPRMPAWAPWVVGAGVAAGTCVLCPECCVVFVLGAM